MPYPLRQMRWQIAVVYTLLIVLILAGLASVLYALTRSTYLRTLESGILGQTYLVAALAESAPPSADSAYLDALIDTLAQRLGARVTLIDPDGRMLADSLLPPDRYASRHDRPEVMAALQSGLGETQRHSTTTGDDRFYVAVPFERGGVLAGVVRVGVPLTTIAATQTQIALAVFAAALLAAAVSFVLAVLIARGTTQPLVELRVMAERLAAGNLEVRVPVPLGEEVGALAQSFNQMASRLRQLVDAQAREHERLAAILATMQDGILILDADNRVTLANRAATELLGLTEQAPFPFGPLALGPAILEAAQATQVPSGEDTRLIDELAQPGTGRSLRAIVTRLGDHVEPQTLVMLQDLTELRHAERSRHMLLTNITHDLRTPLASLQALVDALVDGAIDDSEAARDFLNRMDIEVQGLSHLVDELLELSRIELGQLPLRRSLADLSELLRTITGRMEAQAKQKGVRIAVYAPASLPSVNVDRGRIEQILLNVLQNALTYTPAGGSVTVSACPHGNEVVVAVQDTGIGIEASDLPYIFDRFYKADPARRDGGFGLGLAIAKHLVEHHSGRIWADSAPGSGTTITFTLPTCSPP
jgi:two-component system phosphate regulon sensor histidine kinase PhoR